MEVIPYIALSIRTSKCRRTTPNTIDMKHLYELVLWPESQTYMEEPWFKDEAVLADFATIGEAQAYFIPIEYTQT